MPALLSSIPVAMNAVICWLTQLVNLWKMPCLWWCGALYLHKCAPICVKFCRKHCIQVEAYWPWTNPMPPVGSDSPWVCWKTQWPWLCICAGKQSVTNKPTEPSSQPMDRSVHLSHNPLQKLPASLLCRARKMVDVLMEKNIIPGLKEIRSVMLH